MVETHPEKRFIGYARVSTYGQTLDVQLEQLRAAGCSSRNIYREKATGARADRRELLRMLGKLAPGDVVMVTRIDRLARSTFDLFAIVKQIVDAKAEFGSLAEPWADTGTSTGRLMIAILSGLADVERDLIRTRTAEGRSRAKAQGAHMGRPSSLTPAQQKEATRRRAGRYVAGIGRQLRPQHFHHAPRHARSLSSSGPTRAFIGHDLFHRAVIAERPACPRCNVARGASPNSFLRLFCTAIRHPALLDLVFGTVK